MTERARLLLALLALLAWGGLGTPAPAAMIVSTFDADPEGWTTNPGGGTIEWFGSGGNPGGYITVEDVAPGFLLAVAPAAFHGDLGIYDGGTLSFDLIEVVNTGSVDLSAFGTVTIEGGGSSVSLDLVAGPTPDLWTTYEAPLTAAAWGTDAATWAAILADVSDVTLVLDAQDGTGDVIGVDDFAFINPLPAPAGIALVLLGGLPRRRRRV